MSKHFPAQSHQTQSSPRGEHTLKAPLPFCLGNTDWCLAPALALYFLLPHSRRTACQTYATNKPLRHWLLTGCKSGEGKTLTALLHLHGGTPRWHAMPHPTLQPHPLFRHCNAATPLCTDSNQVAPAWGLQVLDTARLAHRGQSGGLCKEARIELADSPNSLANSPANNLSSVAPQRSCGYPSGSSDGASTATRG